MRPLFGITYSPPKMGKTLALVRAFPGGLFLCLPGGLDCVSWLGLSPANITHKVGLTVDEMIAAIKAAGSKYPAIVLDDMSLQLDAEFGRIKKKDATWSGNNTFNQKVFELRDVCRDAPVPVFWTMHEQPPKEVKKPGDNYGKVIKGTVAVSGWQLPEKLPAMASFVGRVIHDDSAIGYPRMYSIAPDEDYITGSRVDFAIPDKFPLNIGEMLRSVGEEVPRLKGFEWMDGVVETLANSYLKEPTKVDEISREAARKLQEKLGSDVQKQRFIRWAIADAFDRANLKRHQASLLDTFLNQFTNVTME